MYNLEGVKKMQDDLNYYCHLPYGPKFALMNNFKEL